jgi:hypothetical protein
LGIGGIHWWGGAKVQTIAVKDIEGKWRHREVSPDVYRYIRQLEMYICFPKDSQLQKLYPKRFPYDSGK